MKLKIIIIDDEADAIDVIESIIEINKSDYEIVAKTTNPVEGVGLILQHKPDVVFLDVEMPELNGFQILESIPHINFEVIFATAYENYAIKAIKENALDYILKPATIPEVLEALEKAKSKIQNKTNSDYKSIIENLNSNYSSKIKIPTSTGFELLSTDELVFLEADGSYTIAHFVNSDKLIISKPLKQLEPLLDAKMFFRVHRSFIVNTEHIRRFNREKYALIMLNNKVVPISRRRYDNFMEFLKKNEKS